MSGWKGQPATSGPGEGGFSERMAWRPRVPPTGRGPKSYRRADARIAEDVNDRLLAHPSIDATEVEVRVERGEVTLSGVVAHKQEKRMIEDLVEGILGVCQVHNHLRLNPNQAEGATVAGQEGTASASGGADGRART